MLTPTLGYSLAAETGGTLFAALGKAVAEPNDVKYHEVADLPGGKLLLLADTTGVRAVWTGPHDVAPSLFGVDAQGNESPNRWHSISDEGLSQTEQHFPWVDGRAVIVIGTIPRRALAIQL